MKAIGFDRTDDNPKETNYKSYKDEWVIIGDGDISSGKVMEVYPDRIILMPYHAVSPLGGIFVHEIIRDGLPLRIPINERTRIRPYSEEETQEYCRIMNRQSEREFVAHELEYRKKKSHLDELFSDGSGI